MKSKRHPEHNITLTLPGDDAGTHSLSAQRFLAYDPSMGETEQDAHPAFETLWEPNNTERLQLANGADIRLRIWGERHPPVNIGIEGGGGEARMLDRGHIDRALETLHRALLDRASDPDNAAPEDLVPDLEEFRQTFAMAVGAAAAQASAEAIANAAEQEALDIEAAEAEAEAENAGIANNKCEATDPILGRCTLQPGHAGAHMGIDGTFESYLENRDA